MYAFPIEICNGEYFQAACSDDELIIMQSAQFGRMRLGTCVKEDLGYLGCGTDVLHQLDDVCSGKVSCNIQVTPQNIPTSEGCRDGLEKYLDTSFVCKKGENIYLIYLMSSISSDTFVLALRYASISWLIVNTNAYTVDFAYLEVVGTIEMCST